ncbi:MAG: GNAT family N-acetyltransferase [Phycisphaeraceae bacterium]|nr:GNAT family N-acetyltransferase [Phycisphaeraceae bacterium]
MLAQTTDAEFESCYAVLTRVTDWLNARGIRQWLRPLPRSVYERWQRQGCNYHYLVEGKLAAVVSLVTQVDQEWQTHTGPEPVLWVHALAVERTFAGRGIGRSVMQAITQLRQQPLWLTCVNHQGFLPAYYRELGFTQVAEEQKDYGQFGRFNMTLMRSV